MKYCIESLKKVPVWRLIFAAVWLLGMALAAYNGLSYNATPSFQEIVLLRLNDITTYSFFFILLLLIADLGFDREDCGANTVKKPSFWHQMAYAAFVSALIIVVYIIFSLFFMLVIGGNISFYNEWNSIEPFGFEWASPLLAMLIVIPLFFLRLVFLICLVSAVNSRCRQIPYGYAAGFAVCLIDGIIYFHFRLDTAVGIFPFEHAYLESVFGLTNNMPLNFILSVLYWLLLLGAASLIYRSKKLAKGVN